MGRIVWDQKVIQAVRKYAELSTVYRANGTPLLRKDWDAGLEKLQSQDSEAYRIVKKIPIANIKWFWSKYQNVAYGYCASTHCKNKIEPGRYYCQKCKPGYSGIFRGFSRPVVRKNMEAVKQVVGRKSKGELADLIIRLIDKLPYGTKKDLLGSDFTDMVNADLVKVKSK